MNFTIIGGDNRQGYLAEFLSDKGHFVSCFGLEKNTEMKHLRCSASLSAAIGNAEIVILPIPVTKNSVTLNAPFAYSDIYISEIISGMKATQMLLGGKIPSHMLEALKSRQISAYDYLDREELSVLNAIPTAEGALEIAIHETSRTLFGSKVLCIGFGRIGKILSRDLLFLGAETTASARKFSDIAWIKAGAINPVFTHDIPNIINQFDIIFNTVPHLILDKTTLDKCRRETLIIDLASAPGGVDFDYAASIGITAIPALSLPGKVAPLTAAEIVGEAILNIINEIF
ncbi:MAG: dipicolinate synthase subunit DpsA [Oscillospiraceae bacterium]